MRWLLIDEFTEIRKGSLAKGRKCVTRSDEALTDEFPVFPMVPHPLMCEMMAQVGGVLVGATIDFKKEVVLAKITDARFLRPVVPPASLEIEGALTDLGDTAARTSCLIRSAGEIVAKGDVFFGLFDFLGGSEGRSIVFSENFMESFAIREILARQAGERTSVS